MQTQQPSTIYYVNVISDHAKEEPLVFILFVELNTYSQKKRKQKKKNVLPEPQTVTIDTFC